MWRAEGGLPESGGGVLPSAAPGEGAAGVCGEEASGRWAGVASGDSQSDCLQNGSLVTGTPRRFALTDGSGDDADAAPRATPRLPCHGRLTSARRPLR